MEKIRIATVFSGIGAPEQALRRMGIPYEIIFACDNGDRQIEIDYDKEIKSIKSLSTIEEKIDYADRLYSENTRKTNFVEQSYKANYSTKYFFQDVKLIDGKDFENKVDIFIGGSPCQSFSIAGARGGFEDTRGTLFHDYCQLVKDIKPEIFIYENVYGVLTHDHKRTWQVMLNSFEDIGYSYSWQILDAKDYGIPQGRRRVFVVGFKNEDAKKKFSFPLTKDLNGLTMQSFLLDNCAYGNCLSDGKGNIVLKEGGEQPSEKLFLSQKLIDYVMSPGTKNFYHPEAKIDLPIARAILSTQGNTHRASVNNYVTTDNRIRALDPIESLRLMGFTDNTYHNVVSKAQCYKQSGNSIVVDVLIALFKEIFKASKIYTWKE